MKRFGLLAAVLGIILAVGMVASPVFGEALLERPGAYYWGDSGADNAFGADGIIGPPDLSALRTYTASGVAGAYDGCRPQSILVQELDGDGIIGPPDLNIIRSWTSGVWGPGGTGRQ